MGNRSGSKPEQSNTIPVDLGAIKKRDYVPFWIGEGSRTLNLLTRSLATMLRPSTDCAAKINNLFHISQVFPSFFFFFRCWQCIRCWQRFHCISPLPNILRHSVTLVSIFSRTKFPHFPEKFSYKLLKNSSTNYWIWEKALSLQPNINEIEQHERAIQISYSW